MFMLQKLFHIEGLQTDAQSLLAKVDFFMIGWPLRLFFSNLCIGVSRRNAIVDIMSTRLAPSSSFRVVAGCNPGGQHAGGKVCGRDDPSSIAVEHNEGGKGTRKRRPLRGSLVKGARGQQLDGSSTLTVVPGPRSWVTSVDKRSRARPRSL